jgi:ketosteroid isomerase-like protein
MSQENVEIVRRQFKAWSAGNLDEWAEAWDRDVVVIAPKGWPEEKWKRASTPGDDRLSGCATPGPRPGSKSMRFGLSKIEWSFASVT